MRRQNPNLLLPQDVKISMNKPAFLQNRWSTRLLPWWNAAATVLPVFLATRFVFLVLTYLGVVLFTVPDYSFTVVPFSDLLTSWNHFDEYALPLSQQED